MASHDQDILLLFDSDDESGRGEVREYLSNQIGCPVQLVISKRISSNVKESLRYNSIHAWREIRAITSISSLRTRSTPVPYYCPITETTNVFQLLRLQNSVQNSMEPLMVYANACDAHEAAEQNPDNNQFCIFRVQLLQDTVVNPTPLLGNRRFLNDTSTMYFDRMWIYVFNL